MIIRVTKLHDRWLLDEFSPQDCNYMIVFPLLSCSDNFGSYTAALNVRKEAKPGLECLNCFCRMMISILSGQSSLRIMPLASGRSFYHSWWFPIIFGASFSPKKMLEKIFFKFEPYVPGEEEPPNWLESTQVCSFLHLQNGNSLN